MNAVGFDLGSHSLKLVETINEGNKMRLVKAIEYAHPFGVMIPPDDAQVKQMAEMIKQQLIEQKIQIKNIRCALPESVVSTKIIATPSLSDAELASAIDWLAEQHIAIPLEEIKLEYEVLYRPPKEKKDENMRVMLIGVPKTAIASYMKFFDYLEVEPVAMETQIISVLRTLVSDQMPTTLLVHMGASSTEYVIVHDKEIVFVFSSTNGGRLLTRSIERGLNLDTNQAEEYKKSYGVDSQFLEGRLAQILDPVMRVFVSDIQKALQYFTSQYGTLTIKRIVLSGGPANMPGIVQFFAGSLQQEIVIANPFESFVPDTKVPIPLDRAATFSVAVGLTMRSQ